MKQIETPSWFERLKKKVEAMPDEVPHRWDKCYKCSDTGYKTRTDKDGVLWSNFCDNCAGGASLRVAHFSPKEK